MGLCTSRPVVRDEDELLNDGFKPHSAAVLGGQDCVNAAGAQQQIQGVSDVVPHPGYAQDAHLSSGSVAGSGCTTAPEPSASRSSAAMILEVKKLLQDLANIQPGNLCISCTQAAAAIMQHLHDVAQDVAHVSIIATTSNPTVCITPGINGQALDLLNPRRIITNASWAARLPRSNSGVSSVATGSSSEGSDAIYYTVGLNQQQIPEKRKQRVDAHMVIRPEEPQAEELQVSPAEQQQQDKEVLESPSRLLPEHQQQQDEDQLHDFCQGQAQQQQQQIGQLQLKKWQSLDHPQQHDLQSAPSQQQQSGNKTLQQLLLQALAQDMQLQEQQQQHEEVGQSMHPGHWAEMRQELGMQTFLAVPIRDATGGLLGFLELASKQQNAFMEDWWDPVLSIVCSGLVPLLSCPIASSVRAIMGHLVDVRHDFNAFASLCIQGVAALLDMVTNLHLGVRLGLLSPDGQQVLLLYVNMPPPATSACDEDGEPTGDWSSSYFGSAMTAAPTGRLLAEVLDADQTLLAAAVAAAEPRVMQDTTSACLEEDVVTATDIFVGPSSHTMPNSIMVVPLMHPTGKGAFGGLYVTQSQRGDFNASKSAIECVATGLRAIFSQRLVIAPSDWSSYLQPAIAEVTPGSSNKLPRRRSSGSGRDDSSTFSRRNSSNLSHSSLLGTMVKAIQTDVLQYLDAKKQYEADIQLFRILGRGGFGTVFEGRWQSCRAAVKVMYMPENLRRLMKCALEMATMATISHPNIVRVYTCLTDMVEETGAVVPGQVSSPRSIRFRPALPEDYRSAEDEDQQHSAICNVMVMELCDLGNLRRALEKGLLHKPLLESRRIVVDMELLLEVLLDIARSIQYIHNLNMVHCDIKAENVLLQSNSNSSKQFVCKLSDFGLMKVMHSDKMYLRNMSISGTITHVAPERLEGDSQLTTAVDSYGFGMLMWEVYTSQAPFATCRPAEIVKKIYRGERPPFPANTPAPYQQLAEACWCHNPALRPSMDVIVQQLQIWRAHLAANPPA